MRGWRIKRVMKDMGGEYKNQKRNGMGTNPNEPESIRKKERIAEKGMEDIGGEVTCRKRKKKKRDMRMKGAVT